jgi:malate/lactate dehydrogenase
VELGALGIDKIIELNLTPDEKKALDNSAADVKVMIDEVDAFLQEEG